MVMKYQPPNPKRFCAVRKWKDGGESTEEYFATREEAQKWIRKQRQPVGDEFQWMIGEW